LDVYNPETRTVFDYKFGEATMRQPQLDKILQQGPPGSKVVTIKSNAP
jgi:hypothetical protein